MSDVTKDTVLETGTVMQELIAKAKEARNAGRSRRDFFASTVKLAGATALGAAGIGLVHPLAARAASRDSSPPSTDTAQDILNIACTAEALAITFYYYALEHVQTLPKVNSSANRNYFQAALYEELYHLQFLESAGGTPLATQFYFPIGMFTNQAVFFQNSETLETYFIAAYLAAALDFSGAYSSNITTANPYFLGAAVQIGGVEAEHRALLRVAQGVNPPNNVLIETYAVQSVQDAATALGPFLAGGSGFSSAPTQVPSVSQIENAAAPYNQSYFPAPTFA